MVISALDDLSDIGLLFLASAKAGRIPSADAMRHMVNAISAAKDGIGIGFDRVGVRAHERDRVMEQSEKTDELFKALTNCQATIEPAMKDSLNQHLNSHYASLASVWDAARGPLADNGLSAVQEVIGADRGVGVTTQINHISGQWIRLGPLFIPADKVNAHGYGSAISYGKRYGLCAALGIVSEDDDDGAAASKAGKKSYKPSEDADWTQWTEPPQEALDSRAPHIWYTSAFKGLLQHCGCKSAPNTRALLKLISPSELIDFKKIASGDPVYTKVAWEKLMEKSKEIPFHKMLSETEKFAAQQEQG